MCARWIPQTGLCRGCLRTIDEIAGWIEMTPTEKLATLERIAARRMDYTQRRGAEDAEDAENSYRSQLKGERDR